MKKQIDGDEEFEDNFEPLSAEYLLERGYCCGNGCKNCPYHYKNVPLLKREELLKIRREKDES